MKAVVEFKKRNVSKRNIEDVRGVVESTNNIYIYYYEKEFLDLALKVIDGNYSTCQILKDNKIKKQSR